MDNWQKPNERLWSVVTSDRTSKRREEKKHEQGRAKTTGKSQPSQALFNPNVLSPEISPFYWPRRRVQGVSTNKAAILPAVHVRCGDLISLGPMGCRNDNLYMMICT